MAKIIDYPRASLRAALQLAEAVDGFAGSCSVELAAEQLGKKVSGAFSAQIGATAKYGLIESKGGKLTICPLYRNYKLAYTPEESAKYLREALLSPPLFKDIYDRFKGQRLPIAHFEKMMIREFQVPEEIASRVAGYFLDGAKQCGLLSSDNFLAAEGSIAEEDAIATEENGSLAVVAMPTPQSDRDLGQDAEKVRSTLGSVVEDYWINIRGPGMNFSIEVKEADDLQIVQFTLKKIEKALMARSSNAPLQL
jgi:hypothetical protein